MFIVSLLLCLIFSVTAFAENVFIIEDGEEDFVPDTTTTAPATQPAETTTSSQGLEDLLNPDSLGGYLDSFKDKLGQGIEGLLGDFDLGSFDFSDKTTAPYEDGNTTNPPKINSGAQTPATQSSSMTTFPDRQNDNEKLVNENQNGSSQESLYEEELPSVLVVGGAEDNSWGISGSTLTMLVFVAAIVILALVVVVILVLVTRRTEFDSVVKNKSTLPAVSEPSPLAQFLENDDIASDGKDYGNIAYWNDKK